MGDDHAKNQKRDQQPRSLFTPFGSAVPVINVIVISYKLYISGYAPVIKGPYYPSLFSAITMIIALKIASSTPK